MSEQTSTSLREAENTVVIEGYLKEKKLEYAVNDNRRCIRGDLVITDGGTGEYRVRYFTYEKTKEGKDINIFKGLETVLREHVSVAEALQRGLPAESATRLRFTGVRLASYVNNGRLYTEIRGSFPPKVVTDDSFEPKAEFMVELYFNSIRPEYKDDSETGRVLIEGIVPVYGGKVCVLNFVAEGGRGQYILNNYSTGRTSFLKGNIVNTAQRIVTTTEGFDGLIEKVTTKFSSELAVTNGSPEQYDEEDNRSFNPEAIKKAMVERQAKIDSDSKKANEVSETPSATVGFGLPQSNIGRTLNF